MKDLMEKLLLFREVFFLVSPLIKCKLMQAIVVFWICDHTSLLNMCTRNQIISIVFLFLNRIL